MHTHTCICSSHGRWRQGCAHAYAHARTYMHMLLTRQEAARMRAEEREEVALPAAAGGRRVQGAGGAGHRVQAAEGREEQEGALPAATCRYLPPPSTRPPQISPAQIADLTRSDRTIVGHMQDHSHWRPCTNHSHHPHHSHHPRHPRHPRHSHMHAMHTSQVPIALRCRRHRSCHLLHRLPPRRLRPVPCTRHRLPPRLLPPQ